jgi:hypothetical protein
MFLPFLFFSSLTNSIICENIKLYAIQMKQIRSILGVILMWLQGATQYAHSIPFIAPKIRKKFKFNGKENQ